MSWRVLVTGSEGFVGKHLCQSLESAGHQVLGCGRTVAPYTPRRYRCDLTDTIATLDLFDLIEPPTHIVHLAAMTFLPDADRQPDKVIDANVGGLTNLLAAVASRDYRPRVLFVSSCQVYGPPEFLPITEDHPLRPDHTYGISKRMAEDVCQSMIRNEDMDIVIARPFNHTGPEHRPEFSLAGFAQRLARIEEGLDPPVLRVGNLDPRRDYLDVTDVVRAYVGLLDHGEVGQTYNVCRGSSEPMEALLELLLASTSSPVSVESDPPRVRTNEIMNIYGSFDKIHALTRWEPEISIEVMLSGLLAYWRSRERSASG